MSKKVQKTLTGAMAAMMATGVVATPAMAATNTNVDALYKAAYQATQKALTEKTQAAVNEARTAIKALPANMDWAIGEFSKQVDTVQHPILVNIVNSIKKAEKEPTQANINAAKKAIPAELTPVWKNSYSSAVDKLQQDLQKRTLDAVKKAEADKTKASIDAARVLVKDVLTADSQALKDWAKTLSNRLDAIFTLKVTNFKLSANGVETYFEPTSELLKDVTISVIDNKGNTIPVQKVDRILSGKSKQMFYFERLHSGNFEGIWTVNGVSIDMSELTLVNNAVKAANDNISSTNELIALQEAGYIDGLLGSYKSKVGSTEKTFEFDKVNDKDTNKLYNEAIKEEAKKNTITTAEQVQAIIDNVNKDLGVSADEKERVKAIIDASKSNNTTQFINALDAEDIERVNADWAVTNNKGIKYDYKDYVEAIANAKTLKDIQKAIDEANLANVGSVLAYIQYKTDWVDVDKVVEVSDLANAYLTAEQKIDKNTLAQKYYNDIVKEQLALIDVKEADNTSTLLRTLKALSVASDKFDYDANGYDVNIDLYKKVLDVVIKDKGNSLTVKDISDTITTENARIVGESVSAVVALFENLDDGVKYTDSQKKDITDALNKLVAVTAKETNKVNVTTGKIEVVNKFDKAIVSLDLEKYDEVDVTANTVNDLYNAFKDINDDAAGNTIDEAVKAVKTAKSDDLYKALSNELLKVTNLVEANKAEYARDIEVFNKVNDDAEIRKAVTSVNARAEMLKATTVDAMNQGLTKLAISEGNANVMNMSADVRKDVAEEILNFKKADGMPAINLETIGKALEYNYSEVKNDDGTVTREASGTVGLAKLQVVTKLNEVNNSITLTNDISVNRVQLMNALHAITGMDKAILDSKIEAFVAKSTVKKDGVVTSKVTYTTYTQVRDALK
ncbi:hypothetical protein [Clostridium tertium]|uniref:hypothetical protein n=1 Tax=Clostridium tertium TaxID=1559 RepID=UPI0024B3B378|nr:hypothetical protein [Clostridium tertium]MDI9216995.1 hypothetical protein [Clostridium tertium]